MSGIKPQALTQFYRLLHDRGCSTNSLAAELGVVGGTVRKLIGQLSARRGPTWRALCRLLSEAEKAELARVEQCPTWNARQRAKRPVWTPEKRKLVAP